MNDALAADRIPDHKSIEARPALGLPPGSIRALLTLTIVLFVCVQTWRGQEVPLLWGETMMIVLAHYFTSRRMVDLPSAMRRQLEDEGVLEPETHPLYLPRHSIRILIVLLFLGLAVTQWVNGRFWESHSLAILGTVGAYFLGILARLLTNLWSKRRNVPTPQWWTDGKAIVTVSIVLVAMLAQFIGIGDWVIGAWLENMMLAVVLFYFGSR